MKKGSGTTLKTSERNFNLKSKTVNLNESNKILEAHITSGKKTAVKKSENRCYNLPYKKLTKDSANMAESETNGLNDTLSQYIHTEQIESVIYSDELSEEIKEKPDLKADERNLTGYKDDVNKDDISILFDSSGNTNRYEDKIEKLENRLKVRKTFKDSAAGRSNIKEAALHDIEIKESDYKTNAIKTTKTADKLPRFMVQQRKSSVVKQNLDKLSNPGQAECNTGKRIKIKEKEAGREKKSLLKIHNSGTGLSSLKNSKTEDVSDVEKRLKVVREKQPDKGNGIMKKDKSHIKVSNTKGKREIITSAVMDKMPATVRTLDELKNNLKEKQNQETDSFLEKIAYMLTYGLAAIIIQILMIIVIFIALTVAIIGSLFSMIGMVTVSLVTIFSFIFSSFFGTYQIDTKSAEYLTNYAKIEIHADFVKSCQNYINNPEAYHVFYARLDDNGQLCDVGSGLITETAAFEKAYLAKMYAEKQVASTDCGAINQYLVIDTDEEKKVLKEIHDKMFFIEVTNIYFDEVVGGKQVKRRLVRIYGLSLKNYLARYGNEISDAEKTYIEDFARFE